MNFLWSLLFWCTDVKFDSKVFDYHIWGIIAKTVGLLVDMSICNFYYLISLPASAPKIDRLGFIIYFIKTNTNPDHQ